MNRTRKSVLLAALLLPHAVQHAVPADGPADNVPAQVRPVPPPGIAVPPAERAELERELAALEAAISDLSKDEKKGEAAARDLLPDVQIYSRAVGDALRYGEIFQEAEIRRAKELLAEGRERAAQLKGGAAPWAARTGLVVRGFVSRIDRSVQPYGLWVPPSYSPAGAGRFRVDVWLHGRDEKLSELNFLDQRRRQAGLFTPPDTIVLHPYGRYCNAFKLAGEVDVLEALQSVEARYKVDGDRVAVRGFSMGGAGAWHLAVHHPGRWFAANPGAGFAETPQFLKVFQKEALEPAAYERKLWHLYDATDYAANLFHCPTVAYSGEIDAQKQAADVMAEALRREGINLQHVIGPGTAHQYHPESRAAVERLLGEIALKGRERMPRRIRFITYTLKYNRLHWLTVDGLGEHWKQARVEADLSASGAVSLLTDNVTALSLSMPAGWCPFELDREVVLAVDGEELAAPRPRSDRSWSSMLHRSEGKWRLGPPEGPPLRKVHDLQGPIDDAFLDSFLFVRPTGTSRHPAVERWVHSELDRAVERWRRQFRGQAPIKNDSEVSDQDLASQNLVLWGDPSMICVLSRIVDRMPLRWGEEAIALGDLTFPAERHALVLIYPNPLHPRRYVVLNSGFTYREYDDLNNARQVPKLPDWAVIDVSVPPDSRFPGKVAAADFFGESWELRRPNE